MIATAKVTAIETPTANGRGNNNKHFDSKNYNEYGSNVNVRGVNDTNNDNDYGCNEKFGERLEPRRTPTNTTVSDTTTATAVE